MSGVIEYVPSKTYRPSEDASRRTLRDIQFLNPIGLAAGFDKDGELIQALPRMGFGFVEVGTVTLRAQPGNPQPRLFRDRKTRSVFNRMGFNNSGAMALAEKIIQSSHRVPKNFRIGVNIGKNLDIPLSEAPENFAKTAEYFRGLADYLVINLSSPNTPGLRTLQKPEELARVLKSTQNEVAKWKNSVPILIKLAPELEEADFTELIPMAEEMGVGGWVLTNTIAGSFDDPKTKSKLMGGWSGGVLTQRARNSLQTVRKLTSLPIISVGGILTADDAKERLEVFGADLIQLYSGWIYNGPGFPKKILKSLG